MLSGNASSASTNILKLFVFIVIILNYAKIGTQKPRINGVIIVFKLYYSSIKVGALIAESIDISYSNDYSTVIEVLNDKVIIKDKEDRKYTIDLYDEAYSFQKSAFNKILCMSEVVILNLSLTSLLWLEVIFFIFSITGSKSL
jgi:hypothetical protein